MNDDDKPAMPSVAALARLPTSETGNDRRVYFRRLDRCAPGLEEDPSCTP